MVEVIALTGCFCLSGLFGCFVNEMRKIKNEYTKEIKEENIIFEEFYNNNHEIEYEKIEFIKYIKTKYDLLSFEQSNNKYDIYLKYKILKNIHIIS